MDHFEVGLPGGFPDHPHRGFGTVTYLLPSSKGSLIHEDFTGASGYLTPGSIQIMNAGRGIVHAEMPASTTPANGLQLWLNSPRYLKKSDPTYQEISAKDVVKATMNCATANIILGSAFDKTSTSKMWVPVHYIHYELEPNCEVNHYVPSNWNAFVYVSEGAITIVQEEKSTLGQDFTIIMYEKTSYTPRNGNFELDSPAFKYIDEEGFIDLKAYMNDPSITNKYGYEKITLRSLPNASNTSFFLVAGLPVGEPIQQYGPFVMNSYSEIKETFNDFHSGKNGFENAPNWSSTIGN